MDAVRWRRGSQSSDWGAKPANERDQNVQGPGGTLLEQLDVQQKIEVTDQRLNRCILGC